MLRDILYWLSVTARIQFKIAALTFDCVRVRVLSTSSKQSDRFQNCHVGHSVRQGRNDLFVLRANTSIGQRSFSIAAPVVWNALHLTSAHRSTVADSSDQSWKLIFSDKPTTLHDFSENSCLRMKLCNCNYKLPNIDTVLFMYCNYSKHNADNLWLLYCVSLSCVETLALV